VTILEPNETLANYGDGDEDKPKVEGGSFDLQASGLT
jgi:hypothetical protein